MKLRILASALLLTGAIHAQWIQIGNDIDHSQVSPRGESISLSSDGSILAVGNKLNNESGKSYGEVSIFKNISGVWSPVGNKIDGEIASSDFGATLSLSSEGNIIAIGDPNNSEIEVQAGLVKVYENISGVWTQIGNDINAEAARDQFGNSVSLSSDGSILAIGAAQNDGNGTSSGHVRIYKNISGAWTQLGDDIDGQSANDHFGNSVDLSSDGSIVAVGAPFNNNNGDVSGHVQLYQYTSGNWIQIGNDINGEAANDKSGQSVSLSSDGNIVAIGAHHNTENGPFSGHTRVFENITGTWTQIGSDIDGDLESEVAGQCIRLSSDGSILAVGSPGGKANGEYSGHVRMYKNIESVWTQIGNDINGDIQDNYSGTNLGLSSDGSILAVGAPFPTVDDNSFGFTLIPGYVRIYKNSTVTSVKSNNLLSETSKAYPNPVTTSLKIEVKDAIIKEFVIHNTQGKVLLNSTFNNGNNLETIPTSNLAKGTYTINIKTDKGEVNKLFLKE